MDHLDTLAHWLGWADMLAAAVLGIGIGLPARMGHAPPGMIRFLYFGIGFVACRYDLQPLLCARLKEVGYLLVGRGGRWRLAIALPGKAFWAPSRRASTSMSTPSTAAGPGTSNSAPK